MRSSQWWRLIIILVLLAGWTYSLFPLRDRDFLQTFERLAGGRLGELARDGRKAQAEVTRLTARLQATPAPAAAETTELETELAAAQVQARSAEAEVAEFNGVLSRARERLADKANPIAPSQALKEAAKGAPGQLRIELAKYIPVPGQKRASNDLVLSYVRRKAAGKFRLGLDLRGGTEFIIGFDAGRVPGDRTVESVRDQILEILRNRVDKLGVAEPEVKPVGPSSISLRMPSVTENEKAEIRKLIRQTAKLTFHIVHPESQRLVAEYQAAPRTYVPPAGYEYKEMESEREGRTEIEGLFIKSRAERVKGEDIAQAAPSFNQFGNYSVSLRFNARGAAAFGDVTEENVRQRMAIVLDGKVYSAPVIREAITGGNAEISGSFSPEEAQQLAVVLQCGNLPVPIQIDSEFGTDPTLGSDSIRAGLWAGFWGTLWVVLFMLVYYRLSGVVAVIALGANVLLLVGTMTLTGATFTLPGIAGIVLTIGMAVDANILIFERIREEMNSGKTLANAVEAGFNRAFLTIFDSNITTLITGLILFKFGTSSVKGFAVTLSVGIVANMFTAVTLSRVLFELMLTYGGLKKLTMMSAVKTPSFNYFKYKWVTVCVSSVAVLATLVTVVVRGRDCLSIDFAGGTAISYTYETKTPPGVGAVRQALESAGFGSDARIGYKFSTAGGERQLEVVLSGSSRAEVEPEAVLGALNSRFPEARFAQQQTSIVGGLVGEQFQRKAILATLLAWVAIIVYVSFRFEFAYGVASVVALVHDVIVALGVCLLFGRQVSLPVVAALLTIIGFSINDTIVIFDRVRETFSYERKGTYADLVNLSVNQCMSRTILTTVTVFFTVLSLFLFGGGAINDFALTMLGGIISGTYSTIFVASAIIVYWHKKRPLHLVPEKGAAAAEAEA